MSASARLGAPAAPPCVRRGTTDSTFALLLTSPDLTLLTTDGEDVPDEPDCNGIDCGTGHMRLAMWDHRCRPRSGPDGKELDRPSVLVSRSTCCTAITGDRPQLLGITARSPIESELPEVFVRRENIHTTER